MTRPEHNAPDASIDEGGLRAPAHLSPLGKLWWWFDFVILVKLARLRFIAILAVIGVVITQWDSLIAYYDKWTRPSQAAVAAASDTEYFCPMHPSVVRDNNKEKCPICFMPLSKRKKGEQTTEVLPPGVVNRVQLSPYRMVLAGIQTWSVEEIPLTKEIQAVGYVEFNERGLKNVSARVKGRIDELAVNETGQLVAEGDLLASLYSPDLNVTVQNLLEAKRRNSSEMQASAQQRLQLLGISNDQIDQILSSGKTNSHLQIRSPISGHVIKKYVREGQYVDEGSPLYDVADLKSVWIQAQVYEDDMGFLPLDQSHKLTESLPVITRTRAFPGEDFRGTLAFVYPHVDQQSRTVTVRFDLDNPEHKLRPGMTATVTLLVPPERVAMLQHAVQHSEERRASLLAGRVLAIPETSVIDTGSETVVYRESMPGTFEGVLVSLGPKMTGPENVTFFPVVSGLERGDLIATAGSFLVDAETRLNPSAGSIYFGGSGGAKSAGATTVVRPTTPADENSRLTAALKKLTPEDRAIAEKQAYCPILENSRLGSMGVPVKLSINGKTVFVCCPACEKPATDDPDGTLKKLERARPSRSSSHPDHGSTKDRNEAEARIEANLAKLNDQDRQLAEWQRECVILANSRLGSMGPPRKLMIEGQPVFICCSGCEKAVLAKPDVALKRLAELKRKFPQPSRDHSHSRQHGTTSKTDEMVGLAPEVKAELGKLNASDRRKVLAQRLCPISEGSPLGSMGPPVKIMLDGQPVYLCCEGCESAAKDKPQETLAKVKLLLQQAANQDEGRTHD